MACNTNPLLGPPSVANNVFFGFVFFRVVVPGIYHTDTRYTAFLPTMTADVHGNTGADYNNTKVLSSAGTLDPTKCAAYSPPLLSATVAFIYGLSPTRIISVFIHGMTRRSGMLFAGIHEEISKHIVGYNSCLHHFFVGVTNHSRYSRSCQRTGSCEASSLVMTTSLASNLR